MQDRLWFPLLLLSRNAASAVMPNLRNRALVLLLVFAALLPSDYQAAAQNPPERRSQDSSSQAIQDPGNVQVTANQPAQQGLVHIVPFGREPRLKNTFAPANAHLTYWGGPVISQIHVIAVFWGANVDPAITGPGAIDQFFTDITSSQYYDLLTEYSTAGITSASGASSNQSIQRGIFDGKFTIAPANCNVTPPATCSVTDAQIQTELRNQINAGNLPTPVSDVQGNVNSFYMIYFPPGVSITVQGASSCVRGGFCAYHSNTPGAPSPAPRLVPYGVLPDFGPTSGCATGCGRGTLFQNATAVTSHEFSEAITDALVGSATAFAPPLAWYDPDPATNPLAEIGDICAGLDVTVQAGANSYAVQTEFSNVQNDCVSAPPNFNMNSPSAGVPPGISFNLPLTIQSSTGPITLTGYTGRVHFTSSDSTALLPGDYTFTAGDAGTKLFPTTLNTLGDQTITVTDTRSAGFIGTATFNVNTTPDLTISKTHAGVFTVGQSGSYAITVSNTGNGPTTAPVTVVDTLPTALTATAIGGTGWNCTLANLTCTRADALARGANYPAITLAVNIAANAPSSVTNVATVSGGGEVNTANNTASDVTPIAAPDLMVFKFHAGAINGSFFQGETGATYTINVINNGTAPTSAPVTVMDTLPASGLTATAISGTGWTCTLANLTCVRSDVLAAGAGYDSITVTVDVALNAPANVVNTATVSGGNETNTSNDVGQDLAIVLPPPATDLSINFFHPPFIQGQTGAYSIVVSNVGTLASTGTVTVTDTLPTGLTATAIAGSGWTCDFPTLTCTRGDVLAFNSSYPPIVLDVSVAANAPTSVTSTVSVSGGGDSNPGNNTASEQTQIAPPLVDLSMFAFVPGPFIQGQSNAGLTINVNNLGNVSSSGTVTVTANLAATLAATAMNGAGWTCTLSNTTCTRSDSLSSGQGYPSITLTLNVAPSASSTAAAAITVSGGNDGNAANNTSNLSVVIEPAITVFPTSGIPPVNAGQSVSINFFANVQPQAIPVTFSCSGLPTGAACRFNPTSITVSGTEVTMTISTTARTASAFRLPRIGRFPPAALWLLSLAALIISLSRLHVARLKPAVALAGLLLIAVCAGCGGGQAPPVLQTPAGTPAGTYSFTLTAVGANNITATSSLQLTVK